MIVLTTPHREKPTSRTHAGGTARLLARTHDASESKHNLESIGQTKYNEGDIETGRIYRLDMYAKRITGFPAVCAPQHTLRVGAR